MGDAEFGARLRAIREEEGLTQAELAARAGMHKQIISELERGTRQPVWETACRLAKALGRGLDDFWKME